MRRRRQRPRQRPPPLVELRALGACPLPTGRSSDSSPCSGTQILSVQASQCASARIGTTPRASGRHLQPRQHGIVALVDVVHRARRRSAASAPDSAAARREALGQLPLHVHRQAGIARVEPIAVPARRWTHVDRQLDLAARRCRAFGDQFGLDRRAAPATRRGAARAEQQEHGHQSDRASRRSIALARVRTLRTLAMPRLVEVRPQPALGLLERRRRAARHNPRAGRGRCGRRRNTGCRDGRSRSPTPPRSAASRNSRSASTSPGCAAEHVEQDRLQAVVRAGRIAGRRADAVIFLADQLLRWTNARRHSPRGGCGPAA